MIKYQAAIKNMNSYFKMMNHLQKKWMINYHFETLHEFKICYKEKV